MEHSLKTTIPQIRNSRSGVVHRAVMVLVFLRIIAGSLPLPGDIAANDRFGVNADPQRFPSPAEALEYCDHLVASGVKWVRLGPEWGSIETADGIYNAGYLAKLDAIVNHLHARDVNILWILAYTAPWASSNLSAPFPQITRYPPAPAYMDKWGDYAAFIATRYKGKISHWEVWNEPDHNSFFISNNRASDYAEILITAAARLRTVDSTNKIVLGGLALTSYTMNTHGQSVFFDDLLNISGVSSAFDIVNYHAYGKMKEHIKRYNGIIDVMDDHGIGAKPIWITETGHSADNDPDQNLKADKVDQIGMLYRDPQGIERVFYFTYRDGPGSYGFTGANLRPWKSFFHFNALEGAETEPLRDELNPVLAPEVAPLYYIPASSGDGSHVKNAIRIPASLYAYFRVDDNWVFDTHEDLEVDVTYLNNGDNAFTVQYDSVTNVYQSARPVQRNNSNTWSTHIFTLSNARLSNRQNNRADFRLTAGGTDVIVSSVVLRRLSDNSTQKLRHLSPGTGDGAHNIRQSQIPANTYMYFDVHDDWIYNGNHTLDSTVEVDVEYLDEGWGNFRMQYDSEGAAYQSTAGHPRLNTGNWKSHTFTLPDVQFTNRQNNGADFRLSAGGNELITRSVVLRRKLLSAVVRVQSDPAFKLMSYTLSNNSSYENYNPVAYKGGEECRQVTGNGKYFYFDVSKAFMDVGSTNVIIRISFWDSGSDGIGLQYNSTSGAYSHVVITKTNTSTWRTVDIDITNARFDEDQNFSSDFRIYNNYDGSPEYISRVEVIGDYDEDGLPDAWENRMLGSMEFSADDDNDNDGILNMEEWRVSINPLSDDTDGDGLKDGWERMHRMNPAVRNASLDTDGDRFDDLGEQAARTDPLNADSFLRVDSIENKYGTTHILWSGISGVTYRIDRSTDFLKWHPAPAGSGENQTNPRTAATDGKEIYEDSCSLYSSVFYRIVIP